MSTTRGRCWQQVLIVMSFVSAMWAVVMASPDTAVTSGGVGKHGGRVIMMRGPWYDVGHTTYIWGSDTWTSQKWDMLLGPDGTAIILYSAKCPSCSECIKTHVYSLEPTGQDRAFLLSGHGETMLFEMKRVHGSILLAIICFDGLLSHEECRRRNRFQVSVLSRDRTITLDDWEHLGDVLPVPLTDLDTTVKLEDPCPPLFIEENFVTSRLVRPHSAAVYSVGALVGSTILLNCTLGDDDPSDEVAYVYWVQDTKRRALTSNLQRQTGDFRFTALHTQPRRWSLRINEITSRDSDVYICYVGNNPVTKLALFAAVPPRITKTSEIISATKGESVLLECQVSGHPRPSVTWMKRLGQENREEIWETVGQGEQLRLMDVQLGDSGIYKCLVRNGFGPTVRAYVTVHVTSPPEVIIKDPVIYKYFGDAAQLVCQLPLNLDAQVAWLRDGDVLRADDNYVMAVLPSNQHVLTVQRLGKKDFGEYVCRATNDLGSARGSAYIRESWPSGDQCKVKNIPVMNNFNDQKYLGKWERLQTTNHVWRENTFMSASSFSFVSFSGSLLTYYHGYRTQSEKCLEPSISFDTSLDTPGDYIFSSGRRKVVYTDYTNAVIYVCLSIDDEKECPRDRVHVEIVSRDQVIPEDVLSELYTYVAKACVPVSSLIDAVPGLCKVSPEFLRKNGYTGHIEELSCPVDRLQVPRDFDVSGVTGTWHLVATARPDSNSAPYRSSVRILASGGDVIIFFRTYNTTSDLCGPVNVDVLHSSTSAGRYTYGFGDITAYSTFLFADSDSLVLITCLVVLSDGTCRPDSQLVEVFSRSANVSGDRLRVLKQPVANACVDIAKLQRTGSGNCSTPESVVSGVILEDIKTDRGSIGCRRDLVAIADGFSDEQFLGRWHTVYRTTFDIREVREFSKITQAVKTPDGRFQLMIRYHNSTERRRCPPTEVLQLFQESTPGDYTFVYHSNKGAFKVLYMDDEVAVVYWCHRFLQNNQCSTSSLLVEILARDGKSSISGDKLHLLQQHIVNVCVDLQHVKRTAEDPLCTIPARVQEVVEAGEITSAYDIPAFACDGQLLRGTKDIDLQGLTKLSGEWMVLWRTPSFLEQHPPESESFFIIPKLTGILTLWRSYDNELNMCKPTEAGMLESTSGSGDYYYTFDESPEVMKILYADEKHLLTFWCTLSDDDAECFPDRMSLDLLSRHPHVDDVTRQEIMSHVNVPCIDVSTLEETKGDVCKIRPDVITAAYVSDMPVDYFTIGCRKDLIKGQHGVTDDMIVGDWTSILQAKPLQTRGFVKQTTFYFTKLPDGNISVLYRHYSEESDECLPASLMTLQRQQTYSTRFLTGAGGVLIVLYSDSNIMAIVICGSFLKDDTCDPETQDFFVLSRRRAQVEVSEDLKYNMTVLAAEACIAADSLRELSEEPCSIPPEVLQDVLTGELQEDYMKVQCQMRYIPVQENFNLREFAGAWYSHWDTQTVGGRNTLMSPAYYMVVRQDGTTLLLNTSLNPFTHTCMPTRLIRLNPGSKPGSFTFGDRAQLKVVWTDYEQAVMYWCINVLPNDMCDGRQVHVSVWSRREELMFTLPFDLLDFIADTCVSRDDFISTSSELCDIPEDIVNAMKDENRKVTSPFLVIQCAQEFISEMDSFDFQQFSGAWHTVRQTKFMWGNNTWDSVVRKFVIGADGDVSIAYTGYDKSKRMCSPAEVIALQPTSRPDRWTFTGLDARPVTMQVIWTDYDNVALLYTCAQVTEDGLCVRSSLQVEYLSRTPVPTDKSLDTLSDMLPGVCVQESEVEVVATDLCKIPTIVVEAVNMNRDGSVEESQQSCKMEDIALDSRFTLAEMSGVWYEVARTRFTFNKMESTTSLYTLDPLSKHLDGVVAGTMNNQCESPARTQTRKKSVNGPEAVILARIQGPQNIFSWITFYILYYDNNYLMHLACYAERENGTCPRDKTEVTLLGRSRVLTPAMEEKLEALMTSVCLSREDLQLTKDIANCLQRTPGGSQRDGLPATSSCPLNNVSVVENFYDQRLTGVWYGLRTRDYSTGKHPSSFIVSITRNNANTLKMRRWTIQNRTCAVEKSVYIKQACKGSNTGDYISTMGSTFMLRWSSMKVLRFENSLVLLYWCMKEAEDGTCMPDGVRVDVLGRSRRPPPENINRLLTSLSSVCLGANILRTVTVTDACGRRSSFQGGSVPLSSCAVDLLPAQTIHPDQISGLWYETAHSVDSMLQLNKALTFYKPLPGQRLSMFLAAEGDKNECKGPLQGTMRPRCHRNPNGRMLGRLRIPGVSLWGPWQLLYFQQNTSAVVFTCVDERPDGTCSPLGTKLLLMSREPNPSPEVRQQLKAAIDQLGCFDHITIADAAHEGASCREKLDPVMQGGA
ncbi:uncharacterized protein LOC112575321 isoform X3 [Pomacea canaliculata]|uniref:uncharacterized protein LOC112575321 isoform X3 n=1 Tax=Pomacea canaliculata TaxID=400727 RepID=UPI000D73961E|nr:uncharacterized protein LOC112575321 isoform X3 [Pomacea canaliculata]